MEIHPLMMTCKGEGKMKKNTSFIRSSKGTLVIVALLISIFASSFSMNSAKAQGDRIVYVVINVDTDMWGGHDQFLGSSDPHPTLDMRAYALSPPSTVSQVFDDAFRNSHRDSAALAPFQITWFTEMDYLTAQSNFVYADGSSAGVSGYTAINDLLMNNWGAKIQQYGDSVEWMHYYMIYNGVWQRYDNGPDAGYPGYQMNAIDHMIIDQNFYPSTYRSGWLIMPPALSNWLEAWMPFDYTPNSGDWYPWHPAGMNRWQTHCSGLGPNQLEVNATFAGARDNGIALYSFSCNSRDNVASLIDTLHTYLTIADSDETNYPNVTFRYVTAREAIQRALFFADFTGPTFSIIGSGNVYTIASNEPIWNDQPYLALKFTNGTYTHMQATKTATNEWSITPPSGTPLEKIGVASSDLDGNPSVLVISVALTKYLVTFSQTGLDASATGTVVTVNGSAKTYTDFPFSMWVNTGKSISYSFEDIVGSNVSGKRYKLNTFTGPQSPIIVTGPTNVTGNWKQQFLVFFDKTGASTDSTIHVTVNSIQNTLSYSDWFDKDSTINFAYESSVSDPTGTQYVLTSTSGQSPLTIQAPTTVTGYYSAQGTGTVPYTYSIELIALIAALVIIVGLVIAIIFMRRKKP
jgi:hypothetical protein